MRLGNLALFFAPTASGKKKTKLFEAFVFWLLILPRFPFSVSRAFCVAFAVAFMCAAVA